MLKRFFISMLGTMAGLWISIALLVVAGTMIVAAALGKSAAETTVKVGKESVLVLDLSGVVQERYQPSSFIDFIQQGELGSPTLEEMLQAVRTAADDDKIEGIYIKCGGASMGYASREELLEVLLDFKEAGKWIFAYSDSYTQGDYMLATTADELVLNPVGSVDIHGVGGSTPFFTGLLDKLGVKMQIIKVGTYKSAVEPFVLKEMSEPARRQMKQYCDTIWNFVAGNIAANRGMALDSVNTMATQYIYTRPAASFVADSLVTELAYERVIDDMIRSRLGYDSDKDVRFIDVAAYVQAKSADKLFGRSDKHIALLYAVGDISDSGSEGIVGPDMVGHITALADDDKVAGMVFRVNSPGGSAFASEQIWEALEYFKSKDKPLYVSMGDYAASGGYYISCGADSIFADKTTLTGSIGVFGMIPDASGLISGKLGINFSTVESNANCTPMTITGPMSPQLHAAMQRNVENIYDLFTSRVAEGRGMDIDSVKAIAEGRVWVGADAIRLGLVDRIGSLHTAVRAMAADLDMSEADVVSYPKAEEKMWMTILRNSEEFTEAKAKLNVESPFDAETAQALRVVKKIRTMNPVQARMEKIEVK